MGQSITVYYGEGDYSLTETNVKKIVKAVEEYNKESKWSYLLWNFIGLAKDDKKGTTVKLKRFDDMLITLKDEGNDDVQNLLLEMAQVQLKPISELVRKTRATAAEKSVKQAEIAKLIADLPISEDEKAKMVKAV